MLDESGRALPYGRCSNKITSSPVTRTLSSVSHPWEVNGCTRCRSAVAAVDVALIKQLGSDRKLATNETVQPNREASSVSTNDCHQSWKVQGLMKESIAQRGAAEAALLFVKSADFDHIPFLKCHLVRFGIVMRLGNCKPTPHV